MERASKFNFSQRLMIAFVPRLAAVLLRLLNRTLRYEIVVDPAAVAPTPPGLQVWCFWHRCIIPCLCYFQAALKPMGIHPAVLVSGSFDGELIARTIERLGFLTARGSSTRDGGAGLFALAKAVERGNPAVFAVDGPTGPLYKVKPGAVKLAQFTRYPIGILYAHPEKAWDLRSWDRLMIPKPFSRVAISWGGQVDVPPPGKAQAFETTRLEVESALQQARFNAEQYFCSKLPSTGEAGNGERALSQAEE